MLSPPETKGWGLIRVDWKGSMVCLTVKDTIADIPPYKASRTFPVYRIKACPVGVHGGCNGTMPCMGAKR